MELNTASICIAMLYADIRNAARYYMESNYHCGQPILWQSLTQSFPGIGMVSNSASQTQYVNYASFIAQSPTTLSLAQPPIVMKSSSRPYLEKYISRGRQSMPRTFPMQSSFRF